MEAVVAFLKTVPPFEFLPEAELSRLAASTSLEYFPKDTTIISAGHRAADSLYVVHKGAVKLAMRTRVGKELVFDMRSEGEIFGLLSLMGRDIARLDVTAIEDTLCYTIPGETMQELIAEYKDVSDYILRVSMTRYMDLTLRQLQQQTHLMGDTERLLYSLSIKDVATKAAAVCSESTSIGEAARLMASAHATCLAVVGADGRALGVVTDRDFTSRVVAQSLSLDLPVTKIMSTPVISVESSARLFQGLLAMICHDIQHVLVTDEGAPKAVLTGHDLTLLQGKSPLTVSRHLERQTSIEGLADAQKRITDLLPLLLREGAKASHITRVVAEINDRMLAKIVEFAHRELGPAPVPYCWVVLGSEGRREQTFKTDQDNALIYAAVDGEQAAAASEFFARFAEFIRAALEKCGYPPCIGGYMASNPRWCQPLPIWKNYFRAWITEADLRSVEDALIFFDVRPVAGDFSLFEELVEHVRRIARDASFFRSILARITIDHKPPLGFFRTFVVDRSGEYKEQLDIKAFGTVPIVNAARLFAIEAGIAATNTVDRLTALEPLNYLEESLVREVLEAFELLNTLRLEDQLQQSRAGQKVSNYLNPATLTHLQRSLLKESFQTIVRVQSFIDDRFRTAVWAQLGTLGN
jgi:CBS domain-containing protein